MATKLGIYNQALEALGDSVPLASLSEDRSARRALDVVWDNGLLDFCLEQGLWGFATRSQMMTASTSIIPSFGPQYAFELPDDFVGVNSIWIDNMMITPLDWYQGPEAGVIYCNYDTIYIKYTSNAPTYGGNLAAFPQSYQQYVASVLAKQAEPFITNSPTMNAKLDKDQQKAKLTALNWDKRNKPRENLPLGNWTKARLGTWGLWGRANTY